MSAKEIAKVLGRHPKALGGRGKGAFVVLPLGDYQRLCDAVEDALDLMDLERARRENAGASPIPWAKVKRRLGLDGAGGRRTARRKRG